MTGRTHDLAAFTALSYTVANQNIDPVTLSTLIASLGACFIGGLAPDIDQSTAALWNRLPAGGVVAKILSPFLGGHRFISHSILGIALFAILLKLLLSWMSSVVLVDMNIVWWAFMIGYVSHLIIDTFTKEGVPWLFPIPIRFGIPPFKFLRIKTGGYVEKSVVFPGLLFLNVYIYYLHYHKILEFIKSSLR